LFLADYTTRNVINCYKQAKNSTPRPIYGYFSSMPRSIRVCCTKFDVSSFTHSRFMEGVFKILKMAPGPWPCTFGGILSFMYEMGLAKIYPCTKFKIASSVANLSGFKIQNFGPGPWPRPFWGYFITHEMGLAQINPYTKLEVSSFTRSKFN